MSTMAQSRAWSGVPVLSFGFRPFFLAGALQAGIMVALWVPWYLGHISIPTALPPVAWHVHELLFGYLAAVMAGFLLTAVPNWTKRLPVAGWPLLGLFLLWLAGRVGIAVSAEIGAAAASALALAFPLGLVLIVGREVVAAGNRRNLVVVLLLGVFTAGQAAFLAEAFSTGDVVYGARVAIAAALMLVMLIGGRITPSFTTNWMRKAGETRMPAAFGTADKGALVAAAVGLALWAALPALPGASAGTGAVLLAAGVAQAVRQARWRPHRTLAEPLLAVLHLAYAFVPIGLVMAGAAALVRDAALMTAAIHVWTTGAFGLMPLAVMTRATLGHTGRSLDASPGTVAIYAAVVVAAAARAAAALLPAHMPALMALAGSAWVAAFFSFAALYGPMLLSRRAGG